MNFKTSTIDELCNIEYGTRVVRKKDSGTVYPVYGGGGETFFIDKTNRENRVTISRFAMSEECTRFVKDKFFLNDSGLTLSPKTKNLSQEFLDKIILSLNYTIYQIGRGAAQRNLDVKKFRLLKITYPTSLIEQQRIVAKLDMAFAEIDKLIAAEKLQIKQNETIFNSKLDKYFLSQLKDNKTQILANVIEKITYGFTNPMPTTASGNYLITAKNIKGGKIDYKNSRFTSREAFKNLLTKKSKPSIGDILLTKDGSLGRIAIVDRDEICVNQSVAVITPSSKLDSEFCKWQLSAPLFQRKMISESGGTTIKHIYITRVDKMLIYVPSIEQQKKLVTYFNKLILLTEKCIIFRKKILNNFILLKTSILRKELQGEIA
jgi:type I restriction enzyme, S subunit